MSDTEKPRSDVFDCQGSIFWEEVRQTQERIESEMKRKIYDYAKKANLSPEDGLRFEDISMLIFHFGNMDTTTATKYCKGVEFLAEKEKKGENYWIKTSDLLGAENAEFIAKCFKYHRFLKCLYEGKLPLEKNDYSHRSDTDLMDSIVGYRKMLCSEWRIDEHSGPLDADLFIKRRKELHEMEAIAKGRGIRDPNYGSI